MMDKERAFKCAASVLISFHQIIASVVIMTLVALFITAFLVSQAYSDMTAIVSYVGTWSVVGLIWVGYFGHRLRYFQWIRRISQDYGMAHESVRYYVFFLAERQRWDAHRFTEDVLKDAWNTDLNHPLN